MSAATATPQQVRPLQRPPRKGLTPFRALLLSISVLAALLALPWIQQALLRTAIGHFVHARGGKFEAGAIKGSLWERQFSIQSVRLRLPLSTALMLRVEAESLAVDCNPANFRDRLANLISRLSIERGNISLNEITPQTHSPEETAGKSEKSRLKLGSQWIPERLHFENMAVRLATTHFSFDCASLSFSAGPDAGQAIAHELQLRVGRSSAAVARLAGEALWRDAVLKFRNLPLVGSDTIREFEVDLSQIGDLRFSCGLHLLAFGGIARGGLRIMNDDADRPLFEISGTLAGIDVGRFAKFLGREGAFGGTISDARYSFRGHPSNFDKATAAMRLRANSFRWRNRQWDSLILGATLARRRIHFQNLQLRQPGNRIDFQGQADLPKRLLDANLPPFTCEVDAAIDDPAALLALFDISAPKLSGQLRARGQIANESGIATGRLEIQGSKLAFEKTRVSEASATLVVIGSEFSLENVILRNGEDIIEGAGTFSLSPIKTYKGHLNCSIASLDNYREPLSWWRQLPDGGRNIRATWSGDGTANAHSGAFSVQARNLKGLADLPELSGAIAGTYSPEFLYLDRFELSRGDASFEARLAVSPVGLRLDDISFSEAGRERLRGNVTLPVKPGSLAAPLGKGFQVLFGEKLAGSLRVNELRTDLLARFLGVAQSSVSAVVTGSLSVRGTPSAPAWSGSIVVSGGRFQNAGAQPLFEKFNARLTADDSASFAFEDARATLDPIGPIVLTGSLTLALDKQPVLHASIQNAPRIELPLSGFINFSGPASLHLSGPLDALVLSGTLVPDRGTLRGTPLLLPSLDPRMKWPQEKIKIPAQLLDLALRGQTSLSLGPKQYQAIADLRLSGPTEQPALAGTVHLSGPFDQSPAPLRLSSLTCIWSGNSTPRLSASALLNVSGSTFVPLTFVQSGTSSFLDAHVHSITPEALSAAWPQLTEQNTIALDHSGTRLVLGLELRDER